MENTDQPIIFTLAKEYLNRKEAKRAWEEFNSMFGGNYYIMPADATIELLNGKQTLTYGTDQNS